MRLCQASPILSMWSAQMTCICACVTFYCDICSFHICCTRTDQMLNTLWQLIHVHLSYALSNTWNGSLPPPISSGGQERLANESQKPLIGVKIWFCVKDWGFQTGRSHAVRHGFQTQILAPTCLKTVQFTRWSSSMIDCCFQVYFITPFSKKVFL